MKRNQEGFGAIRVILLIVLVGVIGFTGWRVYDANQKTDEALKAAVQSSDASKAQKPGSSSANAAANCPGSSLTLSEINTGGAAGTKGITYAVTNKSTKSCKVQGYPRVALLGSDGKPLGHDAQPSGDAAGTAITLKAGEKAYVTVLLPNPANFTDGQCDLGQSSYLRLTPSGETSSARVALSGQQYCPGFSTEAFTSTLSP